MRKKKTISVRDVDERLWNEFKIAKARLSLKTGKNIKTSEALEEALRDYIEKVEKIVKE